MSSPARDGPAAMSAIRPSRIDSEPSMTSSASTMRALLRTSSADISGSLSMAARLEAAPGMDGERGAGLRLDEQRHAIDRDWFGQHAAEHLVEGRAHARRFAGRDAARQRHVEAERVEHVGIAPLTEVAELLGAQCVGIAAFDLALGQRQA